MKLKQQNPKRFWLAVTTFAALTLNLLNGQVKNDPQTQNGYNLAQRGAEPITVTCPEDIVVQADADCAAIVEYEISAEGGSGGEGTTPTQILFASAKENRVYIANLDGTGTPQVYIDGATDRNVIGLFADYDNEKLYMNNGGGSAKGVYVAPLAGGTSGTQLANSNPTANKPKFYTYVDAVNDRYFFTEADVNGVYVADLSGSGSATPVALSDDIPGEIPHGLDFNPETNTLYVGAFNQSTPVTGAIYAIDVVSGVSVKLFDVGGIRGLQIDAATNRIFWAQHNGDFFNGPTGEIMVANLDGTGTPEVLVAISEASPGYFYIPADVLYDPSTDTLYWSEFDTVDDSRVRSIAADGSDNGNATTVFNYVNEAEEGGYMRGLAFATAATAGGGSGELTITQTDDSGLTSGDAFPVGDTVQQYTVTDDNGNTATCSFTITVEGDIPQVTFSQSDLPDFCQGGTLLTANSDTEVSYQWGNGETTDTIEIFKNGNYEVTVTSSNGCSTTASVEITDFDEQAEASSYTLLATDEIHLHDTNTVEGNIGVNGEGGKIKLHDNTVVNGFAKAADVDIDHDSSANPGVEDMAAVDLPTFYFNEVSNNLSPDIKVQFGLSLTLSGDEYGKVEVKDGGNITFTEPNVFIEQLKVDDDSSVSFSQSTNLYLQKKLDLNKNSKFNELGINTVVVYAEDKADIEEGSIVNANIYSLKYVDVKGKVSNATTMTGQFIGKKIKGNKNVNWNAASLCSQAPIDEDAVEATTNEGDHRSSSLFAVSDDTVKLWPVPSKDIVNLSIFTGNDKAIITIEVFDVLGKRVLTDTFSAGMTYQFGESLEKGVYFIKIKQDTFTQSLRFVKQ